LNVIIFWCFVGKIKWDRRHYLRSDLQPTATNNEVGRLSHISGVARGEGGEGGGTSRGGIFW